MRVVQIKFAPWDKEYSFSPGKLTLVEGDCVIVKTDLGKEIGQVVGFGEIDETKAQEVEVTKDDKNQEAKEEDKREIKPIIRKATFLDLKKLLGPKEKKEALDYCKKMIDKHALTMKLVDVIFSFDNSKMTFAFIADGRIDFRELVKDLARHFNRTIRLYQIGIRDEAKLKGDCGPCGQSLCCRSFLKGLTSITSEMAECQQVVHRGSERISGMCGRLMCCLSYENKGYQELSEKMPPIGTKVNVDGRKGEVVNQHILKQSVGVKFIDKNGENEGIVEVDLNRKKK